MFSCSKTVFGRQLDDSSTGLHDTVMREMDALPGYAKLTHIVMA